MGSIDEKAKGLKKLILNADQNEYVLIKIKVRGVVIAKRIVNVQSVTGNSQGSGYFTLAFQDFK